MKRNRPCQVARFEIQVLYYQCLMCEEEQGRAPIRLQRLTDISTCTEHPLERSRHRGGQADEYCRITKPHYSMRAYLCRCAGPSALESLSPASLFLASV